MTHNRRRFVRIRATLRFTFAWVELGTGGDGQPPAREHFELFRSLDLSASGALVVRHVVGSPTPVKGQRGQFAFNLDSLEVRGEAEVVRLVDDGFGVRFVALSRALEDRIVAWVFRMEAQRVHSRGR